MKKLRKSSQIISCALFILLGNSCNDSGKTESSNFIDTSAVRTKIEALGKEFSEKFKAKDSVALANLYSADGMLGSIKGHQELVTTFSKMMKNGSEKGTPNLLFTTNSITTDDEYVVELGIAQWADIDGNVKSESKYVVVWKQENNEWKIYRDWGL